MAEIKEIMAVPK